MPRLLRLKTLKVLMLFVIWRLFLFFLAFISPKIIPVFGAKFPYYKDTLIDAGLPHFIWSFGNFDGVHYLRIAQHGYDQFTQAFFPSYPAMIKVASYITFGNLLVAALLISNVAFLLGLLLFFKLVDKIYGQNIATWSCIFLLVFPTSFYFGSVYTEGIFFLMIISTFYLYEKKKMWQASIVGAFAAATRIVGILLLPALMYGKNIKEMKPLILIPLGLVAYMVFLTVRFQNPIYFLTAQSSFAQERSANKIVFPPQVFYRYSKILITTNGPVLYNAVFELSATIFALMVLLWGINKVKSNWLIFSFLAILTPTLTGTFASMPRYIIIAFPIFIILAKIESLTTRVFILLLFTVGFVAATIIFTQGYWVA